MAKTDGDAGFAQESRLQVLNLGQLGTDDLDHPHLVENPVADLVHRPHADSEILCRISY